jgi:predicted esterase
MRVQAKWVIAVLFALPVRGHGDDAQHGFFPQKRVREATRLDWGFAAGVGAKLPGRYDSRQQRYQLFVPASYKPTKTLPLVVFVSPGDDPMGWSAWQRACEDRDWFFAAAYGVGNSCSNGQRVRAILDVLYDVRRHYRIDPDRTYLAGFAGGAEIASQIAFALPEHFGGVVAIGGETPLPELDHLRRRASERLSCALVSGSADRVRRQLDKYQLPLLGNLRIRSRLWIVPEAGHALPPARVLVEVQHWLEEDVERRRADREEWVESDETAARRVLAAHALAQARKELDQTDQLYRGVARLQWLMARWPRTDAGEKASDLLTQLRADPDKRKALAEQTAASRRELVMAEARALEAVGRTEQARKRWEQVADLAEGEERRKAKGEAKRVSSLVARTPYLGISFAGDTTTINAVAPGGPAHRAGVRVGDRLERVGKAKVVTADDVRDLLRDSKPGDKLDLDLRRKDGTLSVIVVISSPPARDEAGAR